MQIAVLLSLHAELNDVATARVLTEILDMSDVSAWCDSPSPSVSS